MADDLFIGLDAGTSVTKAVAFDDAGHPAAVASRPNHIRTGPDGRAEQDPAETWETAAAALRDLGAKVPGLAERAAALGITAHGDGTWLIDRAGEAVGPGITWLDARAAPIVEEWRAGVTGPALQRITGTAANPCLQTAQLARLRREQPDLIERAAAAIHCKDWLYLRCTGRVATDPTEGVLTFGNYRTRAYDDEVLEVLGLPEVARLRPGMVDGTVHHDPLTAEAAAATGLLPGTPVALGPIDATANALGSGLYHHAGRVGVSVLGSAGLHFRLYRDAGDIVLPDEQVGYTMPFPVPGTWCSFVSQMAATLNLDWLAGVVAEAASLAGAPPAAADGLLDRLSAAAAGAEPGRLLYQPHIAAAGERGPFVDPAARAGWVGLSMDTTLGDLARAVFEAIGLGARACYEALGHRPDEVRVTGGAAHNPLMRAVLAGAVGSPVRLVTREENGAAGAALVGAVSVGRHPSVVAALEVWVEPFVGDPEAPDSDLQACSDRVYPAYRDAPRALRPLWTTLHTHPPTTGDDR